MLQGRDEPCPFCTNAILEKNQIHEWEFENPLINRHTLLKDVLIDFKGHAARMEIAEDVTDQEMKNYQLQNALEVEKIVVECIQGLYETNNPQDKISTVLRRVGEFLKADRAYVFEIKEEMMNNTYEWCHDGIASQINFCQGMDLELLDLWLPHFEKKESFVVPNIDEIKDSLPEVYEALSTQNIKSVILSPLYKNNKLIGYIGVDNPNLSQINEFNILDAISSFFSLTLERMEESEKLMQSSYIDSLTGLYNRNRFIIDVESFSDLKEQSMAIVYIDINGLKDLNDILGHLYGDSVLVESANHLKEVFKGDFLYRIGGDEFVVLAKEIDEETVIKKVSELQKRFFASENCKAAIGYTWTNSCEHLGKKIAEADEIMYEDKMRYYQEHPNNIRSQYTSSRTLKLAERSVLKKALENNEFEIYLQPKVDFKHRQTIGAEALVRYRNDKNELIMPDKFIPAMEHARTISLVDFYVFEKVCQILTKWHEEGIEVPPISVNFSRYTLLSYTFIETLNEIWQRYQIPKSMLEIEIIESNENISKSSLLDLIKEIRQAGFPVSIDDFGVKYSNMALFVDAELDTLKLDKSLLRDITTNRKSQLLIGSLGQMCRNLDIRFIVEGVETEEQFELLKNLDCYGAQGYLISRPIPTNEFERRFL